MESIYIGRNYMKAFLKSISTASMKLGFLVLFVALYPVTVSVVDLTTESLGSFACCPSPLPTAPLPSSPDCQVFSCVIWKLICC